MRNLIRCKLLHSTLYSIFEMENKSKSRMQCEVEPTAVVFIAPAIRKQTDKAMPHAKQQELLVFLLATFLFTATRYLYAHSNAPLTLRRTIHAFELVYQVSFYNRKAFAYCTDTRDALLSTIPSTETVAFPVAIAVAVTHTVTVFAPLLHVFIFCSNFAVLPKKDDIVKTNGINSMRTRHAIWPAAACGRKSNTRDTTASALPFDSYLLRCHARASRSSLSQRRTIHASKIVWRGLDHGVSSLKSDDNSKVGQNVLENVLPNRSARS